MTLRRRTESSSIENRNFEVEDDFEIDQNESTDIVALDVDMISILQNPRLKGDLKWYQYYKALERYLFKRDPTFQALQFTFDVQEDSTGGLVYIIKPGKKKKKSQVIKLLKYAPSIIGPLLGATLAALLR
jgi:hypothetical protein